MMRVELDVCRRLGCGIDVMKLMTWVLLMFSSSVSAQSVCDDVAGHIVSVQGQVTVDEVPSGLADEVCAESLIVASPSSRVSIRLTDTQTVLRIDQNSRFVIHAQAIGDTWLELLKGALHLFSREPESFRIDTPYVNAAIDGTEFVIVVNAQQTEIRVFEGRVSVVNDKGTAVADAGQGLVATATEAPRLQFRVSAEESVRWAFFYRPIGAAENADPVLREAAQWLSSGEFEKADALLVPLTADATALALRAVIAVSQNRRNAGLQLAATAVRTDSTSTAAYLALSYAEQSLFLLPQALSSARQAVENGPADPYALLRMAELILSTGDVDEALDAVQAAVQLDADLSLAQALLGFVHLIGLDTRAALAAFSRAIALDQTDPLPRLGQGLTRIREGNLVAGREDIENAVSLDPNNSLIRSYLGKAYFEEGRSDIALEQYRLARRYDPNDPTPLFYEAILSLSANQPVAAYRMLERAKALNGNRAVYRSRLLLDQDDAAANVGQAQIYDELGFDQLAVRESAKALEAEPLNHAALQMLADGYAFTERHELARASVLFQSRLLQPLTLNPVPLESRESSLLSLPTLGSARPSVNEFNALFDRQGYRVTGAVNAGSDNQWGDQLMLSALYDKLAFSLGQFHHESDGFRANNDVTHDLYNASVQWQASPHLTSMLDWHQRATEQGDLRVDFDPSVFDPRKRETIEDDTLGLGLRFTPDSTSTLLFSVEDIKAIDRDTIFANPETLNAHNDLDGQAMQLQWSELQPHLRHRIGFSWSELDSVSVQKVSAPLPDGGEQVFVDLRDRTDEAFKRIYYHTTWLPLNRISVNAGLSYSDISAQSGLVDSTRWVPRFGVRWQALANSEFRIAYGGGTRPSAAVSRTLEPLVVAGFNTLYDDTTGTEYNFLGVAYDHAFSVDGKAGLSILERRLEAPLTTFLSDAPTSVAYEKLSEHVLRAYGYRVLSDRLTIGMELLHERFRRDNIPEAGGGTQRRFPEEVDTWSVQGRAALSLSNGVVMRANLSRVRQDVEPHPTQSSVNLSEDFTILDLGVGYYVFQRHARLGIDIRNVFDERFSYQDQNIQTPLASNPRYALERQIQVNLRFYF